MTTDIERSAPRRLHDSDGGDARQRGFTLIEMLFALGVLVFGVTSLIGVLSVGVSTRRTAEQRSQAAFLIDDVVYEIEQDLLGQLVPLSGTVEAEDEDLVMDPIAERSLEAYPGMKYSADFVVDPIYSDLILATIRVSWLEQGSAVGQTFRRILSREKPFSQRVEERRKLSDQ